ncbi:MAG: tetratricopeptide repeat protein [Candidatus Polarisedimenticolia bacterium]
MRTANHEKAINDYEEALRLFQKKDWNKAIHALEQVTRDYPIEREVCDRARIRIRHARMQVAPAASGKGKDPDADYYLGVIAANDGRLDEAVDLLERAVKQDAGDRALYSLAAVFSLKGDGPAAIGQLRRAISINAANRTMALNDPDFDSLRDDQEFLSLLGKASGGDA